MSLFSINNLICIKYVLVINTVYGNHEVEINKINKGRATIPKLRILNGIGM